MARSDEIETRGEDSPPDHRKTIDRLTEAARERYRTAEDQALHVLRSAIEIGLFQPGEWLRQDQLASLIGTSRMPVRAALRQLDSEGLVTLEPHRGAMVRVVLEDEIRDLYELRIIVESFAIRRVAHGASEDDIRRLDDIAERIDGASTDAERGALTDDFYRRLYGLGNSGRVVALVMQLRSEVNRHGSTAPYGKDTHRELLDALALDDADLAAAWLAAHLRRLAMWAMAERSHDGSPS
ncbi:MAG: GntR family transcriptional regulator [Acidimicrobiia bacterium]